MANPENKQKRENFILSLFRDIFFGGKGYKTVKGEKTPFPTTFVIGTVLITLLFLLLVFSWIKTSELHSDIANMKKELSSLEAKEEKSQNELDRLYPFPIIESVAEGLGLSGENGEIIVLPEETKD